MSSETAGPPDLARYDLHAIALAFLQRRESNEELARQWRDMVSASWTAVFPNGEPAKSLTEQAEAAGLPLECSLSKTLHHPSPPIELLRAIKEVAKQRRRAGDGDVSDRVLNAVYHTCIAAVLAAHGESITEKKQAALIEGLDWLAQRAWVGEETRELARRAVARLAGGGRAES